MSSIYVIKRVYYAIEILRWLPNLTTYDDRNIFVLIYPGPYFQ